MSVKTFDGLFNIGKRAKYQRWYNTGSGKVIVVIDYIKVNVVKM